MAFYLPFYFIIKTALMIKKTCFTGLLTVAVLALFAQDKDVQKMKNETKREIKKD